MTPGQSPQATAKAPEQDADIAGLGAAAGAEVVGLELLDDGRVVVVGLRKRRADRVQAFVRVADCPEQFAHWLRGEGRKCRHVSFCLPGHKCISRRLELPGRDPDEIRSMVQFEVAGLVPFTDGDARHAFVRARDEREGYAQVLVFLTTDELVRECLEPFLEQNVVPDSVVASPVALSCWASMGRAGEARDDDTVSILAADGHYVDVVRLRRGRLDCARSVAPTVEGDVPAVALAEAAARGLRETTAARRADGPVLLAMPEAAADKLQRQLAGPGAAVERVELRDVVRSASEQEGEAAPTVRSGQSAPDRRLGDLAGPAVRAFGAAAAQFLPELSGFNLLPRELARRKRRSVLKKELMVTGALVVAVLVLAAAFLHALVARQNRKIALLREQIAPIEATAVSVSEKRDQLAVLNAHLAGRELPLVVLLELYRVTPQGINLVELQVGENNVAITGQARSADLAYAYPSTLMKSDVFSRVHFRGAHPVRRGDGAVTQFSCECRAELPEDAAGGGR